MNPLPPGSDGLPVLGETLPFLRDMFGFIHDHHVRHGDVFRSRILGTRTAFLVGPELTDVWLDPALIERRGALPSNVFQIFGGDPDIVPLLDGEAHAQRKRLLLAAFSREAIAGYLPGLQRLLEQRLAEWRGLGQVTMTAPLKRLAIESLAGAVMSLNDGPELAQLLEDNAEIAASLASLPLPLPGTAYTRGLAARDRTIALLEKIVQRHVATPVQDGLGRILEAARNAGVTLAPATVARELHHFLLAGMIVYAELVAILRLLQENPDVRDRLRAEVMASSPSGAIGPSELRQMPYLAQVIDEVKRICPNVPMSFGRSRVPIDLNGFTIPAGWNVMMAVAESNQAPVFSSPETFDPDRFSSERDERKRHPQAFSPQGAGELSGHKCAGYDFSTVMMQLFCVLALRGPGWELPPQDLALRWNLIPPEHKSGLVVRWLK